MVEENKDNSLLLKKVQALSKPVTGTTKAVKEYEPETHDVFDAALRPKKQIVKPSGTKDKDGNDVLQTKIEEVVRIGLPLQKLIVKRRVAFMNVGKTLIKASPQNDNEKKLLNMVNKSRSDNKLEYKSKEIASRMMSELHCAELWFSEPVDKGYWGEDAPNGSFKMRMKVLSPLLGDKLMPVFDNNGDLIYFGRGYKTRDEASDKEIDNIDIYAKEGVYHFEINGSTTKEATFKPYSYGKIPIIYYSQEQPEWNDVQPAIARLETAISNLGDTNDYNGSPILAVTGKIKGFATKGERGKTLELENGGDIKYVNWDNAPESIRMEIDMLIDFIYTCTQTPNISFKEMQGLGGLSGVAFDRVFLDAHLAAQDKLDGVYGECVQRQINFLKSACTAINTDLKTASNLEITPEFPLFRINDDSERADLWLKVSGNKPMVSQKTAIERAGFSTDAEEEIKQINKESPAETPILKEKN